MKYVACFIVFLIYSAISAQNPCALDTIPPKIVTVNAAHVGIQLYTAEAIVTPQILIKTLSDNCTDSAAIELAIREYGTGTGFPSGQHQLIFGCYYQNAHTLIEVWARDAAGNTAWTVEPVFIQELVGPNACQFWSDPSFGVACAKTETGEFIKDFGVTVSSSSYPSSPPVTFMDFTVDRCRDFPLNGTGFITLYKDTNPLNGVSTFDLVKINQHILGIEPLDSPYKMIAADANRSGSITMSDVLELRKLLLGKYDRLPNNTSWRFIPADYVFPNPEVPFASAPLDTLFNDFGATIGYTYHGVFTGIKIGDVNNSANPEEAAPAAEARTRLVFQVPDLSLAAGEEIALPVQATSGISLNGLQLALRTDPRLITLEGINSEVLTGFNADNFYLRSDNLLRISWLSNNAISLSTGMPVFYLSLKAKSAVRLKDVLWLEDQALPPEIVLPGDEVVGLKLRFEQENNVVSGFSIGPNPFVDRLICRFWQEAPGDVHWQMYNAAGLPVHQEHRFFEIGRQEWLLGNLQNPAPGVYWYRIQNSRATATGTLIRH